MNRMLKTWWLQFLRYGAAIDCYLAERSGDRQRVAYWNNVMFRYDRELELL